MSYYPHLTRPLLFILFVWSNLCFSSDHARPASFVPLLCVTQPLLLNQPAWPNLCYSTNLCDPTSATQPTCVTQPLLLNQPAGPNLCYSTNLRDPSSVIHSASVVWTSLCCSVNVSKTFSWPWKSYPNLQYSLYMHTLNSTLPTIFYLLHDPLWWENHPCLASTKFARPLHTLNSLWLGSLYTVA